MRKLSVLLGMLIVASLVLAACGGGAATEAPAPAASGGDEAPSGAPSGFGITLLTVKARGNLICGVNSQVPGFGSVDADGNYTGLDIDFCKALAAAIFGDPSKVEYRPLSSSERFTALQSGEIDVLIRNTTWTYTRDTDNGANFVHTTFYDGQGMMVRKDTGFQSLDDMAGASICVQTGTTTELNLADVMSARGIDYTPVVFEDADSTTAGYAEGRCDGMTTDKSGLISQLVKLSDPEAHVVLDETMSKEPLGPMVRHGDDQWFDIVQWTVFTTFLAEEFDITSANVDDVKASSESPEVQRLLGVNEEDAMGAKLGLENDFAYNIIKLVGNYAEIYDRNLGPETPTFIPRGLNSLYTDGGLLYSPPFR